MPKPMGVKLRCKECGSEVVINQVERRWATCNGKRILVTMHECGECGSVNVLQLDDECTIKLFDQIRGLVAQRSKTANPIKLKNQAGLFNKLNSKLENRRKVLIKSYVGKKLIIEETNKTLPDGWVMAV